MSDLIQIRSTSKRNILVSAMSGVVGLLVGAGLLVLLPVEYYLVGIFVTSLSLVFLLIAWVKFREPSYSFLLSKQYIIYQCRHGKWQLDWGNIQRLDVPTVSSGLNSRAIDMVGIKLKSYPDFLQHISPRLMTNLLMEQRPLLFHQASASDGEKCKGSQCAAESLLENDHYKDQNGNEFKGIQAMFANRMTKLRSELGYDLFIAESDLDRPKEEFVHLLRQCQQQVVSGEPPLR